MFRTMTNLLVNRQVEFSNGKLKIMGIRDSFTPVSSFLEIFKVLRESGSENLIYYCSKDAGFDWFKQMGSLYPGLKQQEAMNWGIDLVSISGWGKPAIEKLDLENKSAVFLLNQSTTATFFGHSSSAVDHSFRGLLAGGLSYILKEDLDSLEIECSATGNSICRFVVGRKKLLSRWPNLIKAQLTV